MLFFIMLTKLTSLGLAASAAAGMASAAHPSAAAPKLLHEGLLLQELKQKLLLLLL